MGRSGARPAIAAVVIAMLFMLSMVPTVQAAKLVPAGGPLPCTGVSLNPPDVIIGECASGGWPTSSSSAAPENVDANPTGGQDVTVTWTVDAQSTTVDGFEIYRGATPWTLSAVGTADATDRSFTDHGALSSGQALWYAVATVTDGGELEMSQPTPIQPS